MKVIGQGVEGRIARVQGRREAALGGDEGGIALLFEEPGAEVVRAQLLTGVIGAANLAEVLAKLSDHSLPAQEAARADRLHAGEQGRRQPSARPAA